MFRIVTIEPEVVQRQYDAALPRGVGVYRVTHVLGAGTVGDAQHVGKFEDLGELLDQFDAVLVHDKATDYHPELVKFVEAGKHLLIDDPHCPLEIIEALKLAGKDSSAVVACAQPSRFTAYASTIRDAVEDEHLGDPGLIRIHRWEPAAPDTSPELREQRLFSLCFAELDLACWLFGKPPQTVFAQPIQAQATTPTGITVHLGFESGMAILDCVFHQGDPFYTVSLIGSRGAAYGDDHHNTNLLISSNGTQGLNTAKEQEWLHSQILAFINSTGNQIQGSIEDVNLANRLAHAAMLSAGQSRVANRVEAPELVGGCTYDLQ